MPRHARSRSIADRSEAHAFALTVFCCVAALPFIAIRYADIPHLLRVIVRGMGIIIFAQVLFDAFGPVPPAPNILFGEANAHVLFFRWGAVIAVAAGTVGMFRPAYLLPLCYYYILWRHLIGPRTRSVGGQHRLSRHAGRRRFRHHRRSAERDLDQRMGTGALSVAAQAAARHARGSAATENGLADLGGGGRCASGKLFLLGRRETSGRRTGTLDLAARQPHTDRYRHRARSAATIRWRPFRPCCSSAGTPSPTSALAFNFFVLGAQLLAPLAILRVRWLLLFTLLFDMFHIGVYFTLGALFHFWIAVNLIIYTSAWRLKDSELTPTMKVTCILATLFGHTIFYTNFLGWLDARTIGQPAASTPSQRTAKRCGYRRPTSASTPTPLATAALYIPEGHFPHPLSAATPKSRRLAGSDSLYPETNALRSRSVARHSIQSNS